MSSEDVAQLELPWSREMVDGFRLMTGGTIQAALIACGLHDDRTQRSQIEVKNLRTPLTLARRIAEHAEQI